MWRGRGLRACRGAGLILSPAMLISSSRAETPELELERERHTLESRVEQQERLRAAKPSGILTHGLNKTLLNLDYQALVTLRGDQKNPQEDDLYIWRLTNLITKNDNVRPPGSVGAGFCGGDGGQPTAKGGALTPAGPADSDPAVAGEPGQSSGANTSGCGHPPDGRDGGPPGILGHFRGHSGGMRLAGSGVPEVECGCCRCWRGRRSERRSAYRRLLA
ncbi:uncharacterized protein [Nerophis lumbriciformis]|uniref:uncharacterized protein isoform X2 n=1 Tax=Nerophis lumbriciformis TaxID=546530 RepID=UPI003BAB5928